MPTDIATIELKGSLQMAACREALLHAGVDEDAPLVADLQVCALRAETGTFNKAFEVPPPEAPLVINALRSVLVETPYEQQPSSLAKVILDNVGYDPPRSQAA